MGDQFSEPRMSVYALLALRSKKMKASRFQEVIGREDSDREFERLFGRRELTLGEDDLKRWSEKGIRTVPVNSLDYPLLLRHIFEPPLLLFVRGMVRVWDDQLGVVAVVGSRSADTLGCQLSFDFAECLAARGSVVVSGLALGVDSAAHRGALKGGACFPTVAVLGHGLYHLYPARNTKLASEIVEAGGLLMSEFEPDEPPLPHHFLQRNRIIAGLSHAALIVQAGGKSGALVTARYALEEGREVLVIPGAVYDPRYEGSNRLLKQGATFVTSVEDIIEAVPMLKGQNPVASNCATEAGSADSSPQQRILEMLRVEGPKHENYFREHMARDVDWASTLLELELQGRIVRVPGNYISLSIRR